MTVDQSSIENNLGLRGGGALWNDGGNVTISRSTIVFNQTRGEYFDGMGATPRRVNYGAGSIVNVNGGRMNIISSTIAGNDTINGGSAISNGLPEVHEDMPALPGGVFTISNSIIENNRSTSGSQCHAQSAITSGGNNVYSNTNNSGCSIVSGSGDVVSSAYILNTINYDGPNNAFPSYFSLAPGSLALEKFVCVGTDQIDTFRPYNSRCDSGSVEGIASPYFVPVDRNVSFPDTNVGNVSTLQIRVANSGVVPLFIPSLAIAGSDAGQFRVVSGTCGTVAYNTSCYIGIEFSPSVIRNNLSATLTLNMQGLAPVEFNLRGNGLPADTAGDGLVASRSAIVLSVSPSMTSASDSASFDNVGTNTLSFDALSTNFAPRIRTTSLPSNPRTILSGQSRLYTFSFNEDDYNSSALGEYLYFHEEVCNSTSGRVVSYELPIYLSVQKPRIQFSDESGEFRFSNTDVGLTSYYNVYVSNTGNYPLSVARINMMSGDVFGVSFEDCTRAEIQPDRTCTISLRFTPSTSGEVTDTIRIDNSTPGDRGSISFLLRGIGLAVDLGSGGLSGSGGIDGGSGGSGGSSGTGGAGLGTGGTSGSGALSGGGFGGGGGASGTSGAGPGTGGAVGHDTLPGSGGSSGERGSGGVLGEMGSGGDLGAPEGSGGGVSGVQGTGGASGSSDGLTPGEADSSSASSGGCSCHVTPGMY